MPPNMLAKKHAMNIVRKMFGGGLVKQLPQDADLLDEYTFEQYLEPEDEQDEDVSYYSEGGEVGAQGSLRKAFGTSDDNNSYEPQEGAMEKIKRLLGGAPKVKKMNAGGMVKPSASLATALKMKRGY